MVKVVEEVFPRLTILCSLLLGRVGVGCPRVVGGRGGDTLFEKVAIVPPPPLPPPQDGWKEGVGGMCL